MAATSEKRAGERRAGEGRAGLAALVLAAMSVVFSLSMGPRFSSREREVGVLRADLDAVRQEIVAVRRDLALARDELRADREKAQQAASNQADLEVTAAAEAASAPAGVREIQSRLAIMDARQARLYERFNRLVHDLKSSNVDLGVSDRGP